MAAESRYPPAIMLREFANRQVEDFSCRGTLFPGNDERRAKAQSALAATEQEQTSFEAIHHHPIAKRGVGGAIFIRVDEFHADHQPQTAHIADNGVPVL
jgi:hypothetical protein